VLKLFVHRHVVPVDNLVVILVAQNLLDLRSLEAHDLAYLFRSVIGQSLGEYLPRGVQA